MALPTKQYSGSILDAFLPQQNATTKGKTTETTKTDLSPDAINEIIRTMMEGDSGLASILGGQVGAGLYNSTTTKLLANDLAARVAGKAALASAPTTRTTRSRSSAPGGQVDPKYALGMKLLGELVGKAFGTGGAASNGGAAKENNDWFKRMFGLGGAEEGGSYNGPSQFGFEGANFNLGAPMSDFGSYSYYPSPMESMFGFGANNFDSFLSYGLGGGGYGYDPYSLTAGGNYGFSDFGWIDYNYYDFGTNYGGGYDSYDYGGSNNYDFSFEPVNYYSWY